MRSSGAITAHLYLATFVLAFCSIVYELLLGQLLSAFLGNTIVRYSITVGLYMCSMGLGALLIPRLYLREGVVSLLKVEIALSLLGASSVFLLLSLQLLGGGGMLFSIFAHGLIVGIGILTGFEIPLLMQIGNELRRDSEALVLGVDYLGAFLGTVTFALYFYPEMGIFVTALGTALLNAFIGCSIVRWQNAVAPEKKRSFFFLIGTQAAIAVVLILALFQYELVEQVGMNMYIARQ
ncbi:hypothetical protein MRY87_04870 [bacterium]|nr:hypothetical protein [bacterium]